MKKLIVILFISLSTGFHLTAQNGNYNTIPLGVSLPTEMDSIPQAPKNLLINRLQQAASQTGGQGAIKPRFVLSATVSTLSRNILGGVTPKVVHNMELNLYVVDFFEKKIFTSTSINIKGVGSNDSQAYTQAFRQLRSTDHRLRSFLIDSRAKIGRYYEEYCSQVIKRADNLFTQHKYEEGFFTLAIVPEVCTSCYEAANDLIADNIQGYLDQTCDQNLAKAQALWISGQNALNATEAGKYLSKILPDAACFPQAQELIADIQAMRIEENWEFEMRKYQDNLDFKWKQHNDAVALEAQQIEAVRQVGIEEARNQPDIYYTTYTTGWSLFGWSWFLW